MLRVMMLATDLQRGGLPLRLARLAIRLREVEIEPVVGCLAPRGPLSDWLESNGVETFACDAGGAYDAPCLVRLARRIRLADPDLIHASLFHANLAARLVGRLDRRRPIITSTVTIEIERRWHRWGEALTAGWSDWHVANSHAVAEHVRADLGFPRHRVIVIPNGLDLQEIDRASPIDLREQGMGEDVPLIAWAGRMDPVKDLRTFITTIAILRRTTPVQAVLIGDGPERPRVEAWVREAGLGGVIRLTLWSEETPAWLKAADVLLFPSLTEGSPNVVLEAMACDCPVVASDVPAARELLADGEAGLLCEMGRAEQFADAIHFLLGRPDATRSMIRRARELVLSRHQLGKVLAEWSRAYHLAASRD